MFKVIRCNIHSYFEKHEMKPYTDVQQDLQKHMHTATSALDSFFFYTERIYSAISHSVCYQLKMFYSSNTRSVNKGAW